MGYAPRTASWIPPIAQVRDPLWILALAVVGGCKQSDGADTVSPPDLQVVSAGNAPRARLRYHAAAGTKQQLEIAVAVELGANEMTSAGMPTLFFKVTESVDAVMPNGAMTLRTTIDDVSAEAPADSKVSAKAVADPLEALEGLSIHSVLSPTGRLTGSKLERAGKALSPDLDRQIDSLIGSLAATVMPLPDEPVGPGAVWRTSRPVAQNGLALTSVNSVTLTASKPDGIEYKLETDIHGQDQSVKIEDVAIDVKGIVGSGTGAGSIDLGKLAITSELTADLRSEMTAPGETAPTKLEMATRLRVRPR